MAGTIKLKRSAVQGKVPAVGDLALGEIALNTYDGKAYLRGNNGSDFVREISGSGGGSKNYLGSVNSTSLNGNFESGSTAGWSLFNTALTNKLPTGGITAGAASITTFGVVSTGQLSGNYSLNIGSTGAIAAGAGFISDAFTLDKEDLARILSSRFYYSVLSGAANLNFSGTSANTWAVYFYDVANAQWVQPAGVYNLIQNSGVGISDSTFQTPSNGTSFRMALICVTASGGASSMLFDDFSVSPQTLPRGAAISDFTAYTPIFTGLGTPTGVSMFWRRVGDSAHIFGQFVCGTSTAVSAAVSLPPGLVSDSTKNTTTSVVGMVNGSGQGTSGLTSLLTPGSSVLNFGAWNTSVNPYTIQTGSSTFTTGNVIQINAVVPIAGWSSNSILSADTDTRIVSMRCTDTSGVAVNASGATFKYQTKTLDTHAGYSTTTGLYTVPVSGYYSVKASLAVAGPIATSQAFYMSLQKNGVDYSILAQMWGNGVAGGGQFISGGDEVYCVAGDTLSIYALSNASTTAIASAGWNHLDISRLSGPAVVAASESVNALYTGAPPTGTLGPAYNPITYPTKVKDTHNSYSGSIYTVPVSGAYAISGAYFLSATFTANQGSNVCIFINGVSSYQNATIAFGGQGSMYIQVSMTCVQLKAGDTVQINSNTSGTSPTFGTSSTQNWFSIARIGN